MASKGGFDVGAIALNMKRKLIAAGGEGIDVAPEKRPKMSEADLGAADFDEEDLSGLNESELADLVDEDALPAEDDMEAILKLVEEAPEVKQLDVQAVRGLVLKFERALNANVQMRSKFANKPERFMDSEIALDEGIQALQPIAASPELYGELVDLNVVPSLLSLVAHENTDIAICVVNLLFDLFDSDELTGASEDIAAKLVDALMANDGPSVLVTNLFRLEEGKNKLDFHAVHNTLGIFENLVEVNGEYVEQLTEKTKLLKFLCQRIAKDGFDQNKLYASEILAIILQSKSDKIQKAVGDGSSPYLISILKVIAKYRRKDPKGNEETEFVENLFTAVCFALFECPENQLKFAKAEGIELMIAVLRKKKYAKHGAIKALDFALSRCQSNCEKFIDVGGLKVLFSIFMKRAKKKDKAFEDTTTEHVITCLVQLFLNLSDVRYFRLLRKFQENSMEKVERLVELQESYARKIEDGEARYRKAHPLHLRPKPVDAEDAAEMMVAEKEDEYMRKVDNGLFTLQGVDLLLGLVVTAGDKKLFDRVVQLLTQLDSDLERVKQVLESYLEQVGEGESESEQKLKVVLDAIIKML